MGPLLLSNENENEHEQKTFAKKNSKMSDENGKCQRNIVQLSKIHNKKTHSYTNKLELYWWALVGG